MRLTWLHDEETVALDVQPEGAGVRVRLPDGMEHRLSGVRLVDGVLEFQSSSEDGPTRFHRVPVARTAGALEIEWGGRSFRFAPAEEEGARRPSHRHFGEIHAPMSGLVTDVLVSGGEAVEAGQPLAVMEAMKVLTTLEAPSAGRVKAIRVEKGQRVEHGELLLEMEAEDIG